MEFESEKIKRFLLGTLSKVEYENLDIRIISGELSEADLIYAEDELMEDFIDGDLSFEDSGDFQTNFLVTEERRKRFDEISLFRRYAQKNRGELEDVVGQTNNESMFQRFSDFLSILLRPRVVIISCLFLVTFGLIAWQFGFRSSSTELAKIENAAIELNKRDLTNLEGLKGNSKLELISGGTRSNVRRNALKLDNLSENILVRLAIPVEMNEDNEYRVEITQNEFDSISLEHVSVYKNSVGSDLRLLIPKAFIKKGSFRISATGKSNPENVLIFSFQID